MAHETIVFTFDNDAQAHVGRRGPIELSIEFEPDGSVSALMVQYDEIEEDACEDGSPCRCEGRDLELEGCAYATRSEEPGATTGFRAASVDELRQSLAALRHMFDSYEDTEVVGGFLASRWSVADTLYG